jgi:hypothetical protein
MLNLISLILTFKSLTVISLTIRVNIKKFYMVVKLGLNVLYGLSHFTALNRLVTEVQIVYCAVRTESLYKPDMFRL